MMTRDQLAELLATVNAEALSKEADVALKTIYRLRHKENAPTLDTVERLIQGIERLKAKASEATAG